MKFYVAIVIGLLLWPAQAVAKPTVHDQLVDHVATNHWGPQNSISPARCQVTDKIDFVSIDGVLYERRTLHEHCPGGTMHREVAYRLVWWL